jgi:ABC-2 type transport system permease protein
VIRYEFLMQIRKRSLWISTAVLALTLVVMQGDRGPMHTPPDTPARIVMTNWAVLLAILLPIGFGMVLADRLVRDRRLGVGRILDSLPVGPRALVAGKYLGSVGATAVAGLVTLLVAAGVEFALRRDIALFGWAIVAFALVTLPGLLFVGAFAVVVPMLITAPLFRVLFVGYWFWGNLLSPLFLPSLTGTLICPSGDYAASWLLGERALYAGVDGLLPWLRPDPSATTAAVSIGLLLLLALIPVLLVGPALYRRQQQTV